MKKLGLLAAVAAVATVAFPATASAGGGYLGASYGNTDVGGSDADTLQVEGAFGHHEEGSPLGFQIDGSYGNTEGDADDADHYSFAAHGYFSGGTWRLGAGAVFAGVEDSTDDIEEMAYGVEGAFDFGANTVVTVSGTLGEVEVLTVDVDTWNLDASLNHYFSPNIRIGGNIGTGNLDGGGGGDADTFTAGVGAEFQPFSLPVSFNVGYNHFEVDDTFGDLEADTWSVGVRWNLGASSLQERDENVPFNLRTGLFGRVFDMR
jgi:hypothetical protein